jgi:hypothetical protein
MENSELGVAEFRRLCVQNRITAVVEQDKPVLKSYLTGEIDTCPQLDVARAPPTATQDPPPDTHPPPPRRPHKPAAAGGAGAGGARMPAAAAAQSTAVPSRAGAAVTVPSMSMEEMEEQRNRHAALIEQSMQRPGLSVGSSG